MVNNYSILNLGAGVQSTTLYLMYLRGEIAPAIECAVFADTGEEPDGVYRHVVWLKSLGGPQIVVRSVGSRLGDDLQTGKNSTGQRFASIPAFTAAVEGAKEGMVRRQCTKEYKIEVIERYIRREILGMAKGQRVPASVKVQQAYGISLDEAGRAGRIRERLVDRDWIAPVFPLLDRQMTRTDCSQWLHAFGMPHEVQKSACVFCPFKSNSEWRRLRDTDAAGWARAIEVDEALRVEGSRHGSRRMPACSTSHPTTSSCFRPVVRCSLRSAWMAPAEVPMAGALHGPSNAPARRWRSWLRRDLVREPWGVSRNYWRRWMLSGSPAIFHWRTGQAWR